MRSIAAFLAWGILAGPLLAQQQPAALSPAERDRFERDVRPVLVKHCLECHGEQRQEGGLRLDRREALLAGGHSGPAIEPGHPEDSLLISALRHEALEMPPQGPLAEAQIDGLVQWIAAGASWPATDTLRSPPALTDEDRQWWCYQPLAEPSLPDVRDEAWPQSPLDRFVLARLEQAGLQPAAAADPGSWVRRVHFGLTGLPPDPATLQAVTSGALSEDDLIDRLLASPAYGENQARFWLDLVRYADSDGYRADHARPQARLYRDYVIAAFNEDLPYDRFIRQQLAGDELEPDNRSAIVATMYLRHWIYEHNQRDVETQWHEILSDITETTADVFLAQGLKCARCHDHKFDPLLQQDFFRFKAFFAALEPVEAQPVATPQQRAEYQQQLARWQSATAAIRARLREIEYPVALEHATREGFDKFIPEIQAMIRKPREERTPYEQQIAGLSERQFDLPYDKLAQWLTPEQEAERQQLRKQLAEFDTLRPQPLETLSFVATDVGPEAPPIRIPDIPDGSPIAPGFLTLLQPGPATIEPTPMAAWTTGRRATLAHWIASPDNPLTARVIVNRVWQQHFGRGLVATPNDFGRLGEPPSHPQLLDWLAQRFIEDGWSLKALHRRILRSATYRQSSQVAPSPRALEVDGDNRLLWRMNPRRLSGEEIRDALLVASDELEAQGRTIYQPVMRNSPEPLLAAFDGPDRIRSCGRRHQTTTPTQSLLLANSPWVQERIAAIADQLPEREGAGEAWVEAAFERLWQRAPDSQERQQTLQFLADYVAATPAPESSEPAWWAAFPETGSRAIEFAAQDTIKMSLRPDESLPAEDFTVEAVVLLRSLHEQANVRTIVAHWSGSKTRPGWSLGVTSTRSAFQPRNLILQLVGQRAGETDLHYEVVPSGLQLELNQPYFVAVQVDLSDTREAGIRFTVQDLSQPGSPPQVAQVKHTVVSGIRPTTDLWLGSRGGQHPWDGWLDRVRLFRESVARPVEYPWSETVEESLVADWRFERQDVLGHDDSGRGNHAWAKVEAAMPPTPSQQARQALVRVLLNANETLYVD